MVLAGLLDLLVRCCLADPARPCRLSGLARQRCPGRLLGLVVLLVRAGLAVLVVVKAAREARVVPVVKAAVKVSAGLAESRLRLLQ